MNSLIMSFGFTPCDLIMFLTFVHFLFPKSRLVFLFYLGAFNLFAAVDVSNNRSILGYI